MSIDSKDDFIASIKKSGVIEPDRLKEWLGTSQANTPKDLAKGLVRDQLLTKWQAKYLMSGRSRLDIGSYRLLQRNSRDELGDRFLAMHTSLARKVDLQVLPADVTKDESRCKSFLNKASQVGKLDHKNLVHVYDIDQEGGRYFLVTEYVEATGVDQLPRTKLKAPDVAKIISDALTGIEYAHANDVIHGDLTQADLLMVKDDCIKIQNLAVSPLRASRESNATDDFKALRIIGIELLKQLPQSNRCDNYKKIGKLFVDFKPGEPDAADKLAQGLLEWSSVPEVDPSVENETFSFEAGSSSSSAGGFDQPISSPVKLRKKKPKPDATNDTEEELAPEPKKGFVANLWNENPVALIATSVVLALMAFGGSGYAVYSSMVGSPTQAKNNQPDKNTSSKSKSSKDNSEKAQPEKTGPPTESDIDAALAKYNKKGNDNSAAQNNNVNIAGKKSAQNKNLPDSTKYKSPLLKSDTHIGAGDKMVAFPADTPLKFIGNQSQTKEGWVEVAAQLADGTRAEGWIDSKVIYDGGDAIPVGNGTTTVAMNSNPKDKAEPKAAPVAEKQFDLADDIGGIGPATKNWLAVAGVTSVAQLAKMSSTDVRDALKKGGSTRNMKLSELAGWIRQAKLLLNDDSPIKAPAKETAVASKPPTKDATAKPATPAPNPDGVFAAFPRITGLPKTTNLAEKKIGDLVINKAFLLGLEILAEPGVSKTKLIYELTRSNEDKQKWTVGVKKRKKEASAPLGEFRKSDSAFFFKWLPEAAENKYSEYLRNCHLKLKLPDGEATYLTLRKPIKIRDLRLTPQSLTNGIELKIPAMPNPENIVVEVLPMRVSGLELDTVVSGIERGSPGIIMLKKHDGNGFMWIQVDGQLKSTLAVQANLVGRLGRNPPTGLGNMEAINSFIGALKQYENQQVMRNNIKQKQQPKKDQKGALDKEKEQFRKAAEQAKAATNKAIEYKDIVSKLANKPISIRVYAKFGNLQTQLVVTDPKLPQPEPKSKKKKKK